MVRNPWLAVSLALTLAAAAKAQDQNAEGTRQLYYLASPSSDSLPPPPKAGSLKPQSGDAASPYGTLHMGIRYNVVLIGSDGKAKQVGADHVFREGDCFAIDMVANRAAYLYVLARQSSGSWTPLPDMPGQKEVLPTGKLVRIPSGSCFVVHNPPGSETLFVVLSRDPRDFYELYQGIKTSETNPGGAVQEAKEAVGSEKINAAVEHLDERFGKSRDITIARVAEPSRTDEPSGAVYVVNTSKKPATSLVTKIEVRHN